MKLPRDISGVQLAKSLSIYGYEMTRQAGSHIRLTTTENGEHSITIPAHDPIKIGTLAAILAGVANHHKISRTELLNRLRF